MTNPEMFTLLRWGLGICVTGFLFLAGWILKVQNMLKEKVDKIDIKDDVHSIRESIQKIEDAIIGTVDKQGIINKVHEQEETCKRNHP